MKYSPLFILCSLLLLLAQPGLAAQDSYIGDTAIYGGTSISLRPNVLIIFDTSGSMGETIAVETCQTDSDMDGIPDDSDNCPNDSNPNQSIIPCDPNWDTDGDTIVDSVDNCVVTANPGQEDTDGNGIGDACEAAQGSYNPDTNYTAMTATQFCGDSGWGEGYDSDDWTAEDCQRNNVYRCRDPEFDQTGICTIWERVYNYEVSELDYNGYWSSYFNRYIGRCDSIVDDLNSTGTFQGAVDITTNDQDSDGLRECTGWNVENRLYATGNWIDWFFSTSAGDYSTGETQVCTTTQERKNDIAERVVTDLIQNTEGVNFGVMRFYGDDGGTFMTEEVSGDDYTTTVKDMEAIHTGTTTNRQALINIVSDMPASGYTPLGESLYEAMRYFSGGEEYFADNGTNYYYTNTGTYTSPIEASCQPNYIIVITDGMATSDSSVPSLSCGGDDNVDCDSDGRSDDGDDDSLDDVAYWLFNNDLSDDYTGTQNAKTYTIGFGGLGGDADAVQLLQDTADNGQGAPAGTGKSYLADSYQELSGALAAILGEVLAQNAAFVAPVVPTSPENKVYSGKRIYLGFFKPQLSGNWLGNLKKFGLDNAGDVLDKNGNYATDADGEFRSESVSYWGSATDAGNVDEGGVGDILANRDVSTRTIYTYTNTETSVGSGVYITDLTDAANAFTLPTAATPNPALTASLFGVATDTRKNQIINYVYGYDAYDEDIDSNTTEQRAWVMGDILHSKPAIQTYNSYPLSAEATSTNKTIIFVGGNDGQLHAFKDMDGSELWSFIPPSVLPNLQNLGSDTIHEYYMDGSPTLYVYDYDKDGNIGVGPETGDTDPPSVTDTGYNDKVILVVSMRRGGGIDTLDASASRGSYYALDVTDPTEPKFLWELDSTTTGFSELGETWSDAVLGKIRLNSTNRIVAFIGAGYDNNEDLRFGDTQQYPDTTTAATSTVLSTADAGDLTSAGTSAQVNPRGRGIYVLELASIDSGTGVPSVHTSPQKLWEYVYDADRDNSSDSDTYDPGNNPRHSFVASIAPLDNDFDGYIDRLYCGDTGGNMWRFDIGDKTDTDYWSGQRIFSANPSDSTNSDESPATNGRKIFYRPSIVQEPGYVGVYFGTGDRAHPLNKAVIDRLYAFYDRDDITAAKTEADLVNVTEDELQESATTASAITTTLQALDNTSNYGWFIKLDQMDGEKVLANPVVFNRVAYYTTFTPDIVTNDPCLVGELGVGKLYAVDYKTGEAVFNFDTTNDVADADSYADDENERAMAGGGALLRRSDRSKVIGSGIPSGAVIVVREDGTSSALIGCGGGLCGGETKGGGTAIPIYWIME